MSNFWGDLWSNISAHKRQRDWEEQQTEPVPPIVHLIDFSEGFAVHVHQLFNDVYRTPDLLELTKQLDGAVELNFHPRNTFWKFDGTRRMREHVSGLDGEDFSRIASVEVLHAVGGAVLTRPDALDGRDLTRLFEQPHTTAFCRAAPTVESLSESMGARPRAVLAARPGDPRVLKLWEYTKLTLAERGRVPTWEEMATTLTDAVVNDEISGL